MASARGGIVISPPKCRMSTWIVAAHRNSTAQGVKRNDHRSMALIRAYKAAPNRTEEVSLPAPARIFSLQSFIGSPSLTP